MYFGMLALSYHPHQGVRGAVAIVMFLTVFLRFGIAGHVLRARADRELAALYAAAQHYQEV